MATLDKIRLVDPVAEIEQARAAAARYRSEFIDLKETAIDHDLFRTIPVDLMFRYNFVPIALRDGTLDVALSNPQSLASARRWSGISRKVSSSEACMRQPQNSGCRL